MPATQPQQSPPTGEENTSSTENKPQDQPHISQQQTYEKPTHEPQENQKEPQEQDQETIQEGNQGPQQELSSQAGDQVDSSQIPQQSGDQQQQQPMVEEPSQTNVNVKQEGDIPPQQQQQQQHHHPQQPMPQQQHAPLMQPIQNMLYSNPSFAAALQFQAQYYNYVMNSTYQQLQQQQVDQKPPQGSFGLSQETETQNSQEWITNIEGNSSQGADNGIKRARRTRKTPETASRKKRLNQSLRQCSTKVCEKVRIKKRTTYKEVADELVEEIMNEAQAEGTTETINEKNIRRRVYDALNVFMAMQIISKDKKEISWRGLPLSSHKEHDGLVQKKKNLEETVARERDMLKDIMGQKKALEKLYERNREIPKQSKEGSIIQLPFIVVNTKKDTLVDCEMDEDRTEITFSFNAPFELHDDNEILKTLNEEGLLNDSKMKTENEPQSPSHESSTHDFLNTQLQGSPFRTPPRQNYKSTDDKLTPQGRSSPSASLSIHSLE